MLGEPTVDLPTLIYSKYFCILIISFLVNYEQVIFSNFIVGFIVGIKILWLNNVSYFVLVYGIIDATMYSYLAF